MNEAAERLLATVSGLPDLTAQVTQALAAERKATVERIRERIQGPEGDRMLRRWVLAILDEEAAR